MAFDPRSSIKGKSARRRSRFGSTSRPYYNNKQVTTVACKGLKGKSSSHERCDDDGVSLVMVTLRGSSRQRGCPYVVGITLLFCVPGT